MTESGSTENVVPIAKAVSSGCALGRSILVTTGMISSPSALALAWLASVCACTDCDESTSSNAPWHDASDRDTS
jgi:hypothetical protein